MDTEIEESLKRIQSQSGVKGIIVVNDKGGIVKSTFDSVRYSYNFFELVQPLIDKAKSVVTDLDPSNELMVFRVRSKKQEIMLAPGKDFTMIVTKHASESIS